MPQHDDAAARAGCLTEADLVRLKSAPPGRAPEHLARHLADCERCQQRALFGSQRPPPSGRRPAPEWPSPQRALLLLLAVLAALAALLYSLQRLAGPGR